MHKLGHLYYSTIQAEIEWITRGGYQKKGSEKKENAKDKNSKNEQLIN